MTVNIGSCMKSFAGEIEMTGLWIRTEMFYIVGLVLLRLVFIISTIILYF